MKRIFQPGSDLLDKSDKTETHPKKKVIGSHWFVQGNEKSETVTKKTENKTML